MDAAKRLAQNKLLSDIENPTAVIQYLQVLARENRFPTIWIATFKSVVALPQGDDLLSECRSEAGFSPKEAVLKLLAECEDIFIEAVGDYTDENHDDEEIDDDEEEYENHVDIRALLENINKSSEESLEKELNRLASFLSERITSEHNLECEFSIRVS